YAAYQGKQTPLCRGQTCASRNTMRGELARSLCSTLVLRFTAHILAVVYRVSSRRVERRGLGPAPSGLPRHTSPLQRARAAAPKVRIIARIFGKLHNAVT